MVSARGANVGEWVFDTTNSVRRTGNSNPALWSRSKRASAYGVRVPTEGPLLSSADWEHFYLDPRCQALARFAPQVRLQQTASFRSAHTAQITASYCGGGRAVKGTDLEIRFRPSVLVTCRPEKSLFIGLLRFVNAASSRLVPTHIRELGSKMVADWVVPLGVV
jgi:hypothetical protein